MKKIITGLVCILLLGILSIGGFIFGEKYGIAQVFQKNSYLYQVHFSDGTQFESQAELSGFGCNAGKIYRENNGKKELFVDDVDIGGNRKLCALNIYPVESETLQLQFCYAPGLDGGCEALVMNYSIKSGEWTKISRGIPTVFGSRLSSYQMQILKENYEKNIDQEKLSDDEKRVYEKIREYFLQRFGVDIGSIEQKIVQGGR